MPSYKTKIAKGLFGGSLKDTAPYVIPRHISWLQYFDPKKDYQSVIVIDKKYENEVKNARPILSTWSKKNKFKKLPSYEKFSTDPGKPTSRKIIKDPIKYLTDNGYEIKFVDSLKDYYNNYLKQNGIDYATYEGDPADLY